MTLFSDIPHYSSVVTYDNKAQTMRKEFAFVFFISLFSFQLLASGDHDDHCRNLETYASLSHVKQVEIDLTSGIWTIDREGASTMIEFASNGIATMVEDNEGEIEHTDYLWNLKEFNHSVILYLTNPEFDSQKYVVTQNCAGIQLKALDGSGSTQWLYDEPLFEFEKTSIEAQLIGEWQSVADPSMGDMVKYDFNEDGTMSLVENGKTCYGVWEITEDGDFISLSLKNEQGAFCKYVSMRIYDLGYHAASFTNDGDNFSQDIQYFEKI